MELANLVLANNLPSDTDDTPDAAVVEASVVCIFWAPPEGGLDLVTSRQDAI